MTARLTRKNRGGQRNDEAAEPLVARFHAVVGDCVVCLSDKVPVALVRLVGLDGVD